jgi:hypothetical protein
MISEKKIVNIASYNRLDSLLKTIDSVIDQCDELNVILNFEVEEIPEVFFNQKIKLVFSDNSFGDAMKFYFLTESDGYFLTIDDDLIYPPNYVNFMINKCKQFNDKNVITLHGRSFKKIPTKSYYSDATERYSFSQNVKENTAVQFGGTGVMCFHTSLFKLPIEYFKFPNMADVWVGKYCIENNIQIICSEHEKEFVKYIPQKTTIFDEESKNDFIQTQVVNSIFDSKINLDELKNLKVVNQTPNIPIPQPTPPPHEPVKITKTLEKTQKQINYEKVNQIFNNNKIGQQTVIRQTQHNTEPNKKLNSSASKMFTKKKLR